MRAQSLYRVATRPLSYQLSSRTALSAFTYSRRSFSDSPVPDFAFAFDIDGVLLRSSKPIPGASNALRYLQSQSIPFIFLTNGGGKHESERIEELSQRLKVPLDTSMFVQSHTPFAEMVAAGRKDSLEDKCCLIVGGDGGSCQEVARKYGFNNVVTPADIFIEHPTIWPFSTSFYDYYKRFARPLPRPIDPSNPSKSLKIDAIFVFNDPRDWALDTQVILDALLSSQGIMGTYSEKNGNENLPNKGYLQDGQPPIYFSNPDLLWAAAYHLPRLGQGGFREGLEGVWAAVTGGPAKGVELIKTVIGKPYEPTYAFAEKKLNDHRADLVELNKSVSVPAKPLKTVYMIGDNPESDIRGANSYKSPLGTDWYSILVRSGVYAGGEPAWKPRTIVDDVWHAVEFAAKNSSWKALPEKSSS